GRALGRLGPGCRVSRRCLLGNDDVLRRRICRGGRLCGGGLCGGRLCGGRLCGRRGRDYLLVGGRNRLGRRRDRRCGDRRSGRGGGFRKARLRRDRIRRARDRGIRIRLGRIQSGCVRIGRSRGARVRCGLLDDGWGRGGRGVGGGRVGWSFASNLAGNRVLDGFRVILDRVAPLLLIRHLVLLAIRPDPWTGAPPGGGAVHNDRSMGSSAVRRFKQVRPRSGTPRPGCAAQRPAGVAERDGTSHLRVREPTTTGPADCRAPFGPHDRFPGIGPVVPADVAHASRLGDRRGGWERAPIDDRDHVHTMRVCTAVRYGLPRSSGG
ncbi:MAG: hypothetical protein QOH17_3179, partial [Pseudonocardiales bacterium]|nr:hypothetical protein [Pseudonocardiales bacterium]